MPQALKTNVQQSVFHWQGRPSAARQGQVKRNPTRAAFGRPPFILITEWATKQVIIFVFVSLLVFLGVIFRVRIFVRSELMREAVNGKVKMTVQHSVEGQIGGLMLRNYFFNGYGIQMSN